MRQHVQELQSVLGFLLFHLEVLQLGLLLQKELQLKHVFDVVHQYFVNFLAVDNVLH